MSFFCDFMQLLPKLQLQPDPTERLSNKFDVKAINISSLYGKTSKFTTLEENFPKGCQQERLSVSDVFNRHFCDGEFKHLAVFHVFRTYTALFCVVLFCVVLCCTRFYVLCCTVYCCTFSIAIN